MERLSKEAAEFVRGCGKWKNYKSIEEYEKDVIQCLVYSTWGYSKERAVEIVENNSGLVKELFEEKEPADDCCAEIGYFAG